MVYQQDHSTVSRTFETWSNPDPNYAEIDFGDELGDFPADGVIRQVVDYNSDNDNDSVVVDGIPAIRDYEAGTTPQENDVVALTLERAEPPPYPMYPTAALFKLSVSYAGEGRLRFWNSADKEVELFPL